MSKPWNSMKAAAERAAREKERVERVKFNIAYQLDHWGISREQAIERAKKAGLPMFVWSWENLDDAGFRKKFDPPRAEDFEPMTEKELLRGLESIDP